jgi:DNA-binding transcriptional ArsR family regulator
MAAAMSGSAWASVRDLVAWLMRDSHFRTQEASALRPGFARNRGLVYNHIVMEDVELLNATFAALADPTRRAILARLAAGEASVMELAEPFDMSQPAISKHLKVLERAGLVVPGQDAQRRPRKLNARPLSEASIWIETYRQHWEAAFARLDDVLEELKAEKKKADNKAETKDRKRKP